MNVVLDFSDEREVWSMYSRVDTKCEELMMEAKLSRTCVEVTVKELKWNIYTIFIQNQSYLCQSSSVF